MLGSVEQVGLFILLSHNCVTNVMPKETLGSTIRLIGKFSLPPLSFSPHVFLNDIFYIELNAQVFFFFLPLVRPTLHFGRFKRQSSQFVQINREVERLLRFQNCLQIRIPGGPIDIFHMLNFKLVTSRKSRKQQRLVLLHICDFDRTIFCRQFWICEVFWVNRTR